MTFEPRHRGFVDEAGLLSVEELATNPPLAATADIMKVYEEAVQEPTIEAVNLDSLYSQVQHEDTDWYDARILREDFCSTAAVAKAWLELHPDNVSQGVDIDLDALIDTQKRYGAEQVRILQSPAFSGRPGTTTELVPSAEDSKVPKPSSEENEDVDPTSTWAPGAASDRFERRFQARLTRDRAKKAKLATQAAASTSTGPRLTLLHSDVLDLPLPPGAVDVPAPDLIATLNYGLCYFHDRPTLVRYLAMCARTLRPKTGVLVCDQWGGPPTVDAYEPDQEALWAKFEDEVGFWRRRACAASSTNGVSHARAAAASTAALEQVEKALLRNDTSKALLAISPAPAPGAIGTPAEWPRGKLKMVRRGKQHGGFEYWREDGPVDYMTNRFRMSLSFRFSDGSWIRDFFSYDFRIWSLKEITEAMLEAGFARVAIHVLPRNFDEERKAGGHQGDKLVAEQGSPDGKGEDEDDDEDVGMAGVSTFLTQVEEEERARQDYEKVNDDDKVFANRPFATYIMASVG